MLKKYQGNTGIKEEISKKLIGQKVFPKHQNNLKTAKKHTSY